MEEAFFDVPLYREFVQLDVNERMPDESTILRFRHRLEKYKLADAILATVNDLLSSRGLLLKEGSAVDATLIAAPSSTKNKGGKRDPEMHSSKKGNQWHFGMKAHIGVDAESGLVHTVRGTAGYVADVTEGNGLDSMGRKPLSLPMPAIRAPTNGLMPGPACAGTWPCARASAKSSTRQTEPCRCAHGQGRKAQGGHPRQGRAPVSRGQAPVRLREGALPGTEEKHAAA